MNHMLGLKGGLTLRAYPLYLRTLSAVTGAGLSFFAAAMRSSKASSPLVRSGKAEGLLGTVVVWECLCFGG